MAAAVVLAAAAAEDSSRDGPCSLRPLPRCSLPHREWRVFSFVSLNDFMAARGYSTFLVLMYLMVAGVVINVALCSWVGYSFSSGKFDHVW